MTGRAFRRGPKMGLGLGLITLAGAAMLLAGCGQKKTAASNVVEMRDMEVVDGTANDGMTDLDAVRTNGIGANESAGQATNTKAKPPAAEPGAADAEAVASE